MAGRRGRWGGGFTDGVLSWHVMRSGSGSAEAPALSTGRLSAGNNLPAILHLLRTTKAKQLGTSHSRPPSAVQIVPGERAQRLDPGPAAGRGHQQANAKL